MVRSRRRSRLPRSIQVELVKHFCAGATARSAAGLTGVNRNTAILFYRKPREVIFTRLAAQRPELVSGEVEVDESYFGGAREGKRGRGAVGKVPVFGLLERDGLAHAVIIPNASSGTLSPIIRQQTKPDSIVHADSFRAHDALDVPESRHVRIDHPERFADRTNHINGIENSWNQAKRHLRVFNGIPKQHFPLFIKECEWRFNHRPVANLDRLLQHWWFTTNE